MDPLLLRSALEVKNRSFGQNVITLGPNSWTYPKTCCDFIISHSQNNHICYQSETRFRMFWDLCAFFKCASISRIRPAIHSLTLCITRDDISKYMEHILGIFHAKLVFFSFIVVFLLNNGIIHLSSLFIMNCVIRTTGNRIMDMCLYFLSFLSVVHWPLKG